MNTPQGSHTLSTELSFGNVFHKARAVGLISSVRQGNSMPNQNGKTKDRFKESLNCYPRALREFFRNDGLDVAASLSYFMVLAMFPGLLALISLLALAGASESGTKWIMELLEAKPWRKRTIVRWRLATAARHCRTIARRLGLSSWRNVLDNSRWFARCPVEYFWIRHCI